MYYAIVILLMLVSPAISVGSEIFLAHSIVPVMALITKWFVFWAVGVRLSTAGFGQMIRPQFTAGKIFEFKTAEPIFIIRELGFANFSWGIVALLTLFNPTWLAPAAIGGMIFYGLASLNHLLKKDKNRTEYVTLISDFFAFVVLLVSVVEIFIG